jgi:hypothetical protein
MYALYDDDGEVIRYSEKYIKGSILVEEQIDLLNPTPLYTTPPSREWQSLSDEEIEEAVNYLNVKIDYPIMFARLIEMHLKEKNT